MAPEHWPEDVDYVISYGYRHIIGEPFLSDFAGRLLNIHASLLPWNRGADPNFWSWFDKTPKGVSFHLIDADIDTGPIVMQCEVTRWKDDTTLRSSYATLNYVAEQVFAKEWHRFRAGKYFFIESDDDGSYHRSADKDQWMSKLPLGWDTPVTTVERLKELQ